jgi:hypothetical protein
LDEEDESEHVLMSDARKRNGEESRGLDAQHVLGLARLSLERMHLPP